MSAAEAEASGQTTVDVDWAGVNVTLPARPDDWELETLEAFEQGKAATAVRGVLGSDYDRVLAEFQKVNGRKPKVRDLESFMQAFASAYGFESPGESPASSGS